MSGLTFVSTQRLSNPVPGEMRFNTDKNIMEVYDGQGWYTISHGSYEPYQLEVSEGTVYGEQYYTVAPISAEFKWGDMMTWVVETFGPTSDDGVWTPNQRWYANNAKFWFKDKKDLDWFVLRWAS